MRQKKPQSLPTISVLLSVFISACAGKGEILMPDRFDTEILEDGSKRFVFEVLSGPGGEGRGNRNMIPQPEAMETALEAYFSEHPFCEEGYFLYDQGFNGRAYSMLGECQESAPTIENR